MVLQVTCEQQGESGGDLDHFNVVRNLRRTLLQCGHAGLAVPLSLTQSSGGFSEGGAERCSGVQEQGSQGSLPSSVAGPRPGPGLGGGLEPCLPAAAPERRSAGEEHYVVINTNASSLDQALAGSSDSRPDLAFTAPLSVGATMPSAGVNRGSFVRGAVKLTRAGGHPSSCTYVESARVSPLRRQAHRAGRQSGGLTSGVALRALLAAAVLQCLVGGTTWQHSGLERARASGRALLAAMPKGGVSRATPARPAGTGRCRASGRALLEAMPLGRVSQATPARPDSLHPGRVGGSRDPRGLCRPRQAGFSPSRAGAHCSVGGLGTLNSAVAVSARGAQCATPGGPGPLWLSASGGRGAFLQAVGNAVAAASSNLCSVFSAFTTSVREALSVLALAEGCDGDLRFMAANSCFQHVASSFQPNVVDGRIAAAGVGGAVEAVQPSLSWPIRGQLILEAQHAVVTIAWQANRLFLCRCCGLSAQLQRFRIQIWSILTRNSMTQDLWLSAWCVQQGRGLLLSRSA